MTISLTFDDGLADHARIVAPMLADRGWRGSFNVPTEFLDIGTGMMTASELAIIGLDRQEGKMMSWNDAKVLLHSGHEVYPHGRRHANLVRLSEDVDGDIKVDEEVRLCKAQYVEHMGFEPKFFCAPHNEINKLVVHIIRKYDMEPFNICRPGYGGEYIPNKKGGAGGYIERKLREGARHVDLMFHGISARNGGWRPFDTEDDFSKFLDEIAIFETRCGVQIVPYSHAHRGPGLFTPFLNKVEYLFEKARKNYIGRR